MSTFVVVVTTCAVSTPLSDSLVSGPAVCFLGVGYKSAPADEWQ